MCRNCNIFMTLQHLLVDCPALQQKLTPIISFLNRKNKPLTQSNILDDDFNHNLLFNYLKDINFYDKI